LTPEAIDEEALDNLTHELHAAYPTNDEGNVGDQLVTFLRNQPAGLLPRIDSSATT
jgi:hypothetical protein